MFIDEIKNKYYITANDLKRLIPNLTYSNAIKYINEARKKMEERGYLIPIARPKVALRSIVFEMLGIEGSDKNENK